VVHCYYLTCPSNVPLHTAWDIAHAVSDDLVHWDIHGIVLKRGGDKDWDGNCLATGSIIQFKGKYWMAYTGRWNEPDVAVGLAVSDDLYSWVKCDFNPITKLDQRFYEAVGSGQRKFAHWRDPFLFEHNGVVYHHVCASRNNGPIDGGGTLGIARSENMINWDVLPPPQVEPVVQELECPQLHQINNQYFLLFSAFPELFSDKIRSRHGEVLRHATYYMKSETPFGPFRMRSIEPIIPPEHTVQPYACQLVSWKDRLYFLGTVLNNKQNYICDPITLTISDGRLTISKN